MALLLLLSAASAAAPAATALSPLPPSNDEPRHTVCHELSAQARAYYTGDHSYEALSALSGAAVNISPAPRPATTSIGT